MKPRLYISQKITPFVNKYMVYGADPQGIKTSLSALAQQKRLAFKEKVSFFADEQKTQLSFTFRAEKVLDIHGRYLVEDANGNLVGMFKKEFAESLVVSTWKVMSPDGTVLFEVTESNAGLAVFRRFAGWIPIVGGIAELVALLFRYHFVFKDAQTKEIVGTYKKLTLFRDNYELALTDEAALRADWRLLAAMGVGLDALQSR